MAALSRGFLAIVVTLLALAPLVADAAGPLEPDFVGWKRAETAHFVFVFEPRDQAAVSELTSFAEEVYGEVADLLGSYPPRVWVVIAGRVDLANGYTTPFPPHMTLYLAPPSEPLIGLEASHYLRLLFVHELTHFMNFEHERGFFAFLSTLFGPGVKDANAAFLPTWFLEGIATDTETLFTDGGRGRNPFFEMEYRSFVLSHRVFPLSKAAYSSYFPPADRDWIGGYLFFHYLIDHFGKDVYVRAYDQYVKFPLLGPWKAIEHATGEPADEIYRDMVQELEAGYITLPSVHEGRPVTPGRIGDSFLPVITSRGWYLYRTTLDEPSAIVEYDPLTMRERPLLSTPLTDSASLSASADGEKIAFATCGATQGASGEIVASDLFRLDPHTRAVRRVTMGAHAWQPRLSPDGSRLLAVSAVGPCARLVEVQGDGSIRLLFSLKEAIVSTPGFSPDGSKVAFDVEVHGTHSIRVMPSQSPELSLSPTDPIADFNVDQARVVVGPTASGAYYPRFVDNDHLLFSSIQNGTLALLSTDVDGKQCATICEDPIGAWSGEVVGNEVLYTTYRTDGYTLMMKAPQHEKREPPQIVPPPPQPDNAPADVINAVPYVDLPRFLAWSPLPIYDSTIASQEIVAAPGAIFWGVSNLGTSSCLAAVSFRPDALQPAVELSLQTALGTTGLGYTLSEGYTNLSPSDHREELRQQISLSFPLVSTLMLSTSTSLTLSTAIDDTLSAAGPQSFPFLDGLGIGAGSSSLSFSHELSATMGLSFVRTVIGSVMDMFPRSEVLASAAFSAYPPWVSATGLAAVASGIFAVAIPSPVPHQVIKAGIKASYVSLNETFYQFTNPRGAFDPVTQSLPGRALVSIDYQIPIALLDVPLVYSLGLIGIGCGFHIEGAANWGASPTVFSPDQDLYAGAELLLIISAGERPFPVGFGVSFRFDPHFAIPVNLASDLRPYIFVSTDSFAGTIVGAQAVRKPLP